jgi:hypothetical protein
MKKENSKAEKLIEFIVLVALIIVFVFFYIKILFY